MITRRHFVKTTGISAASLFLPWKGIPNRAFAQAAQGTLDPTRIPKYIAPLVIPPPMPMVASIANNLIDYYVIAVRQFQQQILPPSFPKTTVWSYGSPAQRGTFNYPAFTIEAQYNRPIRVKWVNELIDANGNYLPHLLPVDPTLHWANPPGGIQERDMRPMFDQTPGPYRGPVPIVTHVHGAHVTEESDGYAEAWYLPAANNIPAGYASVGTWYDLFKSKFSSRTGVLWEPGTATFQYHNDQRAATLWFHDHTVGMTRLNVYAGPAGFYIVRGGPHDLPAGILPGPAPSAGDAPGTRYFEIPIVIQDRSFNSDGSLFFPMSRAFFDGFSGPYIPDSDISPIYNSEFFGNTIVVNGRTWPILPVEPRRYRLRLLNGCNARFLTLKLVTTPLPKHPAKPALPFWQIGTEGGFLPAPIQLDKLLMGLAERADVIVDFTGLPSGTELFLINEGPDEPFGGGEAPNDFEAANPSTTGQVMKFVVVPKTSPDLSTPPAQLRLPTLVPLGPATITRRLSLNEEFSQVLPGVGPRAALLGTINADGKPVNLQWGDPITENPALNATEIWEFHNFTADAHPMHIHEVQFQVVNRQPFGKNRVRPPEPWETGYKDTVIAYPAEITRVKAKFDLPGRYVWHCHIVDHEDNEMMRPYQVGSSS